ncbi:leucine-rich repeats and immunoglobulin-like domains protein 1 isoform X3 [Lineus longissimus]|uniref:leucine-rich repeats and immunoglobulin-like domains protein 1 isoform X3 n=1 Tax=Lineus longissimus TaxID=88925 RepID=UPI002B4C756D
MIFKMKQQNLFNGVVIALLSAMTVIAACPSSKCTCTKGSNGIEIDCRYKNLNMVPAFTDTQEKYYKLKLGHNNIQEISSRAFHGLNIEKLDLSYNPITRLSPQAFIGLANQLTELILQVNPKEVVSFPPELLRTQVKLRTLKLKGFTLASLQSGLFKNMTNLEQLTLERCRISYIHKDAFIGIEKSLVELNLRGNMLGSVPKESLRNLTKVKKLVLGQNKITMVKSNTFAKLTNLKDLDLSQNKILGLELKAFDGLKNSLEFLGLHVNMISQANLAPLANLTRLEQLNIAHNSLTSTLPDNTFKNMNSLAYLNIQGNRLTSISPATFEGLHKQLKVLLLSENMITKLPDEVFHHFEQLQELYLDLMMLGGTLGPHTFHGLEDTLEYLTMEGVKFQTKDWNSVRFLKNLNTLNLCQNSIDSIVPFTFKNMPKLANLLLSNNIIENITQDDMRGLEGSLQQLVLDSNKINSIDNCTFRDFTVLRDLNLDGNPLHCDCRLLWLKNWMNKQLSDTAKTNILWECSSPPSNRDRHFRFVAEKDLTCPDPQPASPVCKDYKSVLTPVINDHPSINITSVMNGADYLVVRWKLDNSNKVTSVRIYYKLSSDDTTSYSHTSLIHPAVKEYKLSGLIPSANYTVCLGLDLNEGIISDLPPDNCLFVKTKAPVMINFAADDPNVFPSVIIGSALGGALLLLLLVIFIAVTVCKYKKKKRAHMYCTAARPAPPLPSIPQQTKVCNDPMPQVGSGTVYTFRPGLQPWTPGRTQPGDSTCSSTRKAQCMGQHIYEEAYWSNQHIYQEANCSGLHVYHEYDDGQQAMCSWRNV